MKQHEKIKALEANFLQTQKDLEQLKEKYCAKDKQRQKEKSQNKNIFKNHALRAGPIRPDLFKQLTAYINHLQTAGTSSVYASTNNDSHYRYDKTNITCNISEDFEDDVHEQQKKERTSISTKTEEKPNKENNSISITTEQLITDKEVNDQYQRINIIEDKVQLKSIKECKSTSTNTEEEFKDKKQENVQLQKIKDFCDVQQEPKKATKSSWTNTEEEIRNKDKANNEGIRKNDLQTILVAEAMTQTECVIDMEPIPEEPVQETSPDNATPTITQPEHITSNMFIEDMFRSTPNEDARMCLEDFSSWQEFASHTATGQHCREWLESNTTRPQMRSSRGRKRKNTINEEFVDIETYHAFKQMRTGPAISQEFTPTSSSVPMGPPPPERFLMPMPPPRYPMPPSRCLRPNPVVWHHNYHAPVFPGPRGIPVTSTMTSSSATIADVVDPMLQLGTNPHCVPAFHNIRSTSNIRRSMPYPTQRARATRSRRATGTVPRFPPTTETENKYMHYYNQFSM